MRSRLSLTATSGRPTTLNSFMRPEPTSTSTSMRCASIPYTAALSDLKSIRWRESRFRSSSESNVKGIFSLHAESKTGLVKRAPRQRQVRHLIQEIHATNHVSKPGIRPKAVQRWIEPNKNQKKGALQIGLLKLGESLVLIAHCGVDRSDNVSRDVAALRAC